MNCPWSTMTSQAVDSCVVPKKEKAGTSCRLFSITPRRKRESTPHQDYRPPYWSSSMFLMVVFFIFFLFHFFTLCMR